MGRNINTGVWTVDSDGLTQSVRDLFIGADPVYTHADHIDNSFNFCVNGVSEQNSRMCLHMTNRTDNEYTVDGVANIFIPDLIYDNKGNIGGQQINTVLGNGTGGVSNFTIDPNDYNQPSADFKFQPSFNYRNALWYPRVGFAKYSDISNRFNIGYTYYSLNDLDSASTAVDANPDETWWEYYTRKSSDYVMCLNSYHDGTYYTGGSFHSSSIFEGQTRFGFGPAWVSWLSTPHSYGNTYGTVGCYIYNSNGRDYYSDMTIDVLFSLASDAMVKIAEFDDTNYSKPRHNVVYSPKIDKNLVLRLICSYGLPFSFSSSSVGREFADPDYALPIILNNTTTGEYVRGADCITADTENNRWVNTADIDNKPASGGGTDDDDLDDHEMGAGTGISGMANLWLLTKSQLDDLHGAFNSAPGGFDPLNSLISVMGLGVSPIYLFDNIEVITPINIRKSDGTSWSTGVEGHIVDAQKSAFQFTGITVKRMYNNFLDYSPYAIHEIFIPMCGWLTLPDIAVDRSITVTYLPDVESLKCRAVVSVVDNSGNRCVIGEKDGIMGADVPFTNTGHSLYVGEAIINGMNVAGEVITGAIGAGFTKTNAKGGTYRPYEGFTVGMGGTLPGAIGNAIVSGQTNRTHYMTGNGTRIGFSDGENIQIKSTYHRIDKPANYDHTVGKVCNKTGKLSTFSGFTVCDNPHINISALEEEKSEIKALLEQGVIL